MKIYYNPGTQKAGTGVKTLKIKYLKCNLQFQRADGVVIGTILDFQHLNCLQAGPEVKT